MRNLIYILVSLIVLQACKSEKANSDKSLNIKVEHLEMSSKDINPEATRYNANINFYRATAGSSFLVDSINKHSAIFLSSWFNVTPKLDVNNAVINHLKEYLDNLNKTVTPEDCVTCNIFNLNINTEPIYQNSKILSLAYDWNIYEGGAHGYYSKWTLMFDKSTGEQITYKKLVKNEEKLLEVAETIFRKNIGVKNDEKMPDTYSFSNNKFHLSENFMFTTNGLVFNYNPYEIAPYSSGLIEIELPYSEIKDYINYLD